MGARWSLGDGRSIMFWRDRWVMEFPVHQVSSQQVASEMLNRRVTDLLEPGRGWRWELLEHLLPTTFFLKILEMHVGIVNDPPDTIGLVVKDNRTFNVKQAYELLEGWRDEDLWPTWVCFWSLKVHQRVHDFMWLLGHDKMLHNASRWRRGLSTSACCAICGDVWEDGMHVVRDCSRAREVWRLFNPQSSVSSFFDLEWKEWIEANLKIKPRENEAVEWAEKVALICWALWKWRNMEIFEGEVIPIGSRLQMLR